MIEEVLFCCVRKGDVVLIVGVCIDVWCVVYCGLVFDSYLDYLKFEESVKLWEQVLEVFLDVVCIFVVESGGEIIGFVLGMILVELCFGCDVELIVICVLFDEQCKGLGKWLLVNVVVIFISVGVIGFMVWVLSKNEGVGEFFELFGVERFYE